MEAKKSPKANLENKRAAFFQIGIIVTLLMVLLAFEWKSPEKETDGLIATKRAPLPPDEIVVITRPDNGPPPKTVIPLPADIIEIIDNAVKLNVDLIINTDGNDKKPFEYHIPTIIPEELPIEDEVPFYAVERLPLFQNSSELSTFSRWVFGNLVYPDSAKEAQLQGRITIGFSVDTDGSVCNVKVIRGIHASLDNEVVRVILSSPKWTPGKQGDKNVRVSYVFPVIFELR